MADAYTRAIDKVTFRDFLDAISPTPVVGDAVSGLLGLYDTGKGLFGDYKAAQEKDPRKMIRGMAGNVGNYTSGLLNAASVVPLVSPAIAGMFIGTNSKVWDALKADEAQKMLAKGVDPKEVWKKTGTFRGVDGALRQEIPDNKASLISKNFETTSYSSSPNKRARIGNYGTSPDQTKVSDGFNHPLLYDAYPDVKDIRYGASYEYGPSSWGFTDASTGKTAASAGGEYTAFPEKISVGTGYDESIKAAKDKTKSTTLHELQHAIQEREGWARGGSPDDMASRYKAAQDEYDLMFQTMKSNPDRANEIMPILDSLRNEYRNLANPQEAYKRLAGEAEARLTQSRMNMTMPERLQVYPYDMLDVPQDQLIVRGLLGDAPTTAMSMPTKYEQAHEVARQNAVKINVKGKGLLNLPLDKSAYMAKSLGSQGQQIFHDGKIVGTTTGKLKNATSDFVNELGKNVEDYLKRSDLAESAAITRVKNSARKKMLIDTFNENRAFIESVHKNSELAFNPISNDAFERGLHIYQSPNYGKKTGSAYRLIDVNGEPAYARQADHWGNFSTNRYDEYGDLVSDSFNWKLPGAENATWGNKNRYTGYILLKDLIKK